MVNIFYRTALIKISLTMFNVLTIGFKMVTDLGILRVSKGYKDQLLCNHKSFCPEEQLNFLQHGWYTILAAIESYDQH